MIGIIVAQDYPSDLQMDVMYTFNYKIGPCVFQLRKENEGDFDACACVGHRGRTPW